MCAAHIAKVGYGWNVANSKSVLFFEDICVENCILVFLYWDLYVIVNDHYVTIANVWDDHNLKCTFRRTVGHHLYNRLLELIDLVSILSEMTMKTFPF
jgi:hypothetical protein